MSKRTGVGFALALIIVGITGGVFAQTATTAPNSSPAPAAVTTTTDQSRTTAAPVAGANSFTEGQARRRLEERGYTQVVDLKRDQHGVWRGIASKDGKPAQVALDYQGNIVSQ